MLLFHCVSILAVLTSFTHALAQCYLRNGTIAPPQYAPCNTSATGQDGSHTQCCDWVNSDVCLSSGLCLYPQGGVVGMFNADGCTDPTMQDSSCQPYCAGVSSGSLGYLRVVPCQDGTWCCTTGYSADCCVDSLASERFTLEVGGALNLTQTQAVPPLATGTCTPIETTAAATTTTSTSASSNASASGPSQPLSTNVGQTVGAATSKVLLGAFLVMLCGSI
jgi:hypothetical protein